MTGVTTSVGRELPSAAAARSNRVMRGSPPHESEAVLELPPPYWITYAWPRA